MAKNIVLLNRGDSLDLILSIKIDAVPYTMVGGDYLYFGLMRYDQKFEEAFIKKRYSVADYDKNGFITVHLNPEETVWLIPGVYYYSIKLKKADGTVATILPKTKFVIQD